MYERIGENAVAVAQGMPLTDGFQFPRQFNTFYYLSGIETPGAYIRLDGRTRTTTLYLPPRNERLERSEGKVLSANDVDLVKRLTGVDDVQSVDAMTRDNWPLGVPPAGAPRTAVAVYAEFAPAEGAEQSRGELVAAETARSLDFWDGQTSRQKRFVELLRARVPRAEIKDLNPILDDLRAIKSPREIALVRRASQIAGLGMMESIRSTEPGVTEYQLDAASRYIYLLNDAKLEGYRSITASGTANINNGHYYRNSSTLKDGDLVLMDYAPDYRYYVSDIGRMWPVNGKYAPWQRELLQFVLEYRNAVMTRIRPGVSTQTVLAEARQAMDPILARTKFSKPIYEQAAKRMLETSGGVFSHTVGMAVHDVGSYRAMLEARPRLLGGSSDVGARGESLHPLRGHRGGDRHRRRELHRLPSVGTRRSREADAREGRCPKGWTGARKVDAEALEKAWQRGLPRRRVSPLQGDLSIVNPPNFAAALVLTAFIATPAIGQTDDFAAQRALFNYDAAVPLGVVEKGVEKREGVPIRDVTFNALMGRDIAAYIVTPEGKGPFAAVLWVHWLGEPETTNRTQFLNEAVKLASRVSCPCSSIRCGPPRSTRTGSANVCPKRTTRTRSNR